LEEDNLSKQQQSELREALDKLRSKVDVLEDRSRLNEIKFHYEDYKDVCNRSIDGLRLSSNPALYISSLRN
jgi:LETM1 and EF-hand domain-containing protein 1